MYKRQANKRRSKNTWPGNLIRILKFKFSYSRFHEYNVYNILCPILLPLAHIGLTGSIYLTLAVSVERYITVCHPFFKMTHSCPAYFYIIPISFFSIIYNVPKFLELETVVKSSNITSSSDNDSLTLECSFNSSNLAQEESELCQEVSIHRARPAWRR